MLCARPLAVVYNPVQEGNCFAYWTADFALLNGTVVTRVVNVSGVGSSARDLTTPSTAPNFLAADANFGGKPSFVCRSATNALQSTLDKTLTQPSTIYLVMRQEAITNTTWWRSAAGNLTNGHDFYFDTGPTAHIAALDASLAVSAASSTAVGNYVSCCVYDASGGTSAIYMNDAVVAIAKAPGDGDVDAGSCTIMTIGTFAAQPYSWTEMICFNGVHTPAVRKRVMQWLGRKYNIKVLPVDGAVAATWAPTDASTGLLAWFRPDLGLTQASNLVSAWLDQSGAGDANRNQSAAGAAKPGFSASDAAYGNKPVVTGTSTQVMTSAGAWSVAPNPPVTVVIVGENAAARGFVGDPTTTNMIYADASGFEAAYGSATGAHVGTVVVSSPCVIMFSDDGTGGAAATKLFVNDLTTPDATFTTGWTTLTRLDMLADFNGSYGYLTGKMAEVIVFAGILTPTDKANLKTYLNTTRAYGIAVT